MTKKKRKTVVLNVNPQQEKILLPFYVSCLVCLCFFVAFGYFLYHHPLFAKSMDGAAFVQADDWSGPQVAVVVMGLATFGIFLVLIYWAYTVSNKILGPYERIVRELDGILAGERRGPLQVRKNDEMFAGLLQRVNVLLKKKIPAKDEESPQYTWN